LISKIDLHSVKSFHYPNLSLDDDLNKVKGFITKEWWT